VSWFSRSNVRGATAALIPITVAAAVTLIASAQHTATAQTQPPLRLEASTTNVTLLRLAQPGGSSRIQLDLGTYVVAGADPVEIRVTRKSYDDPIVASRIVFRNGVREAEPLPAGIVTGWNGLSKFLHVTFTDAAGKKVYDKDRDFCPNSDAVTGSRPDAPERSPYPTVCGNHPFTLGALWGIQATWPANTINDGRDGTDPELASVPDGQYTATVSVNEPHRRAFGIPADKATATVKVTIQPGVDRSWELPAAGAVRPSDNPQLPANPRPDLRALPAFGVRVVAATPADPKKDLLSFSASTWNGGNAPLVVDAFRPPGTETMEAYQSVFDATGAQVGADKVGSMDFDPREGHKHWHLQGLASYSLLGTDKRVLRRQQGGSCIAPTDPIDMTLANAVRRPASRSKLFAPCGKATARNIRQALDIGWGMTDPRSGVNQSFDISDLPNGSYYIEIRVNPDNTLHESDLDNNTSLREIVLGGAPGARTVTVPPVGAVDA
jgi:hypothetical protein